MRQWWRAGGRSLALPADGVSGATRGAGEHVINLSQHPAFAGLAPGSYDMVVEVSREAGGREVRRLPFTWPLKTAADIKVQGDDELGALQLTMKP
jgi:hypothetical protein